MIWRNTKSTVRFIILSYFLNDAVRQGYFVIQTVRNSEQSERAGSNPVIVLACPLLIHYLYKNRCRRRALLRDYCDDGSSPSPAKSGIAQLVRANNIVAFRIVTLLIKFLLQVS